MYSKWSGFSGILTLSAALLALGCGSSKSSFVRTVNASNGLKNYAVQVGLQGIASSVPYGTVGVQPKGDKYSVNDNSGNYRAIPAGVNQKVIVYTTSPQSPLASGTQTFAANTYYTIVTLAAAPSIEVRVLTDGDAAPSGGNFKLRIVQAAPTAGTVDIYITPQGTTGTSPTLANVPFGTVEAQYLQQNAAAVQVQVTAAGNPAQVLYTGAFTPAAGQLYTAYFLDPPTGGTSTSYSLLLVKDPIPVVTKS